MKVTYNPSADDDQKTTAFGQIFEAGKAVDVTDERVLAKMRGNPSFLVGGEKPKQDDKSKD